MDSWIRSPPSVVAATTGRVSRETRRVLMRQFRSAMREPVSVGPFAEDGVFPPSAEDAEAPEREPRSPLSPGAAGPWLWACWGEEPRSVPRGS
ncbi:hypothetical protein ACF08N_30775 [Streptomyces sp. NPDC015127]|uniref:hypothetical protein n=1 Tax=Streptomyces sp. NPDC015127 TaxID=3364939 RepID=UPI0036F4F908